MSDDHKRLPQEACDVNAEDALEGTALHKAAGRKGAVGPQLIRRLVSGNARLDHQDNVSCRRLPITQLLATAALQCVHRLMAVRVAGGALHPC